MGQQEDETVDALLEGPGKIFILHILVLIIMAFGGRKTPVYTYKKQTKQNKTSLVPR